MLITFYNFFVLSFLFRCVWVFVCERVRCERVCAANISLPQMMPLRIGTQMNWILDTLQCVTISKMCNPKIFDTEFRRANGEVGTRRQINVNLKKISFNWNEFYLCLVFLLFFSRAIRDVGMQDTSNRAYCFPSMSFFLSLDWGKIKSSKL